MGFFKPRIIGEPAPVAPRRVAAKVLTREPEYHHVEVPVSPTKPAKTLNTLMDVVKQVHAQMKYDYNTLRTMRKLWSSRARSPGAESQGVTLAQARAEVTEVIAHLDAYKTKLNNLLASVDAAQAEVVLRPAGYAALDFSFDA
jgi:hypothetical protein